MHSPRLSAGDPGRAAVHRLADERLARGHLVGRSAELSGLAGLVARISGGGGAVLVRGDPWIGTSQL